MEKIFRHSTTKGFGCAQVLRMGDPDREVAAADGDAPPPAAEAESKFAPDRETAQGNLG
jgi:hypothetical protein